MASPVAESGVAELDAAGSATFDFAAPTDSGWHISRVTVTCSVDDPMPQANVYRGWVSPSTRIGGTYTGAFDSAQADEDFGPGEHLIVVFTNGQPGAEAAVSVGGIVRPL